MGEDNLDSSERERRRLGGHPANDGSDGPIEGEVATPLR